MSFLFFSLSPFSLSTYRSFFDSKLTKRHTHGRGRRVDEHITESQFTRCLSELDLLSVPIEREANLLIRHYAPHDGRHEPLQFVHYRRFLLDVDASLDPGLYDKESLRQDGDSASVRACVAKRLRDFPVVVAYFTLLLVALR